MSIKSSTAPTVLKCPHCGTLQEIQRKQSNMKQKGHIKDLWCFYCKDITQHEEVKEEEFYPEWVR